MSHGLFSQDLEGFFDNEKSQNLPHSRHSKRMAWDDYEKIRPQLQAVRQDIVHGYQEGAYPFLSLVHQDPNHEGLVLEIESFKQRFETVLILGTGGSSLGGQSLVALKNGGVGLPFLNPRLYFLDNVDPYTFELLLPELDMSKTGIIAISKSGETTETLAQVLFFHQWMKKSGLEAFFKKNMLIITQFQSSPLYRFAQERDVSLLAHPVGVGGRFSVFSVVGLVPLLLAGLDPYRLREGGRLVLEAFEKEAPQCDVSSGAGFLYLYGERQLTQTVFMPYVDRLGVFAFWFRQLWAESLGKDHQGLTPIRAMGTVDQHSQLQLYVDGPSDKTFTFFGYKKPVEKPSFFDQGNLAHNQGLADLAFETMDTDLSYLNGKTLGDVLWAEQNATRDSLIQSGAPVRVFSFETLCEKTLGGFYMHFMLETLMIAHLMNIDPLTQPAVQYSKELTRDYLSKL